MSLEINVKWTDLLETEMDELFLRAENALETAQVIPFKSSAFKFHNFVINFHSLIKAILFLAALSHFNIFF